jgi:predicted PhzF superfamily epimerase YddE/YHI9
MPKLHILKVFIGEDGGGGNPLGVFLDGPAVPKADRQIIAADLGFSETVFVDDPNRGGLRIFTPAAELPFAGHPLVGTAWLLRREGFEPTALRPPAGEVSVRVDGDLTYIVGRPEWAPTFDRIELDSPEAVEALSGPPEGHDLVGVWAWMAPGVVRVRVFASRLGVEEDEATGAYAVRLCAHLGRELEIHQGEGSLLHAKPNPDGGVEVGGRVELLEERDYTTQGG